MSIHRTSCRNRTILSGGAMEEGILNTEGRHISIRHRLRSPLIRDESFFEVRYSNITKVGYSIEDSSDQIFMFTYSRKGLKLYTSCCTRFIHPCNLRESPSLRHTRKITSMKGSNTSSLCSSYPRTRYSQILSLRANMLILQSWSNCPNGLRQVH
jgi:hypothetical protein